MSAGEPIGLNAPASVALLVRRSEGADGRECTLSSARCAATMKKVRLAPQVRIDQLASMAQDFFRDVLDLDYDECLVTDESRLSDFSSCGLPEALADKTTSLSELYAAWKAWVVPVICTRYRLVDVAPTVLLVDLFQQIEQQRTSRVH
jgi:hypothetical protein